MVSRKTVADFAEVMKAYGLTKLEIKDEEKYVLLETGRAAAPDIEDRNFTKDEYEPVSEAPKDERPEEDRGYIQKSIVVGTVYLSPAEGMDEFVKIGDRVTRGDVIAMVESMKMFNEINAEETGVIREILVSNGQTIEYGQPLFIIDTEKEEA